MEKRGGGSILTLTYLGSERVFPNYNVMGVAKAALEVVGAVSRRGSRPEEHPRERDLGRADQDARGVGHRRLLEILQVYRDRTPLKRNTETAEVADAARFLLGPAAQGITGEVLIVDAGYQRDGVIGATGATGATGAVGCAVRVGVRDS